MAVCYVIYNVTILIGSDKGFDIITVKPNLHMT
jgi:hypothetical protein